MGSNRMMLEFIYNSKIEKPQSNAIKILDQLKELGKSGIECKIIDTFEISEEKLKDMHYKACKPSIYKHYKIREKFGNKKHGYTYFGKNQPALLVYEENMENPIDTYPHIERDGKEISIKKFIDELKRSCSNTR